MLSGEDLARDTLAQSRIPVAAKEGRGERRLVYRYSLLLLERQEELGGSLGHR